LTAFLRHFGKFLALKIKLENTDFYFFEHCAQHLVGAFLNTKIHILPHYIFFSKRFPRFVSQIQKSPFVKTEIFGKKQFFPSICV